MLIKSFGCSFISGTDLADAYNVWPSLIAHKLGINFKNCAFGGIGNQRILAELLKELGENDNEEVFYIIQWTWQDRFDYVDDNNHWQTCRPSLDTKSAAIYFKNFHSSFIDTLRSLSCIYTAIEILKTNNIPFVMTAIDDLIWQAADATFFHPASLTVLQNRIEPFIKYFDGMDFLTWSRQHNFAESKLWHPLDDAHQAAAEYVIKNWALGI